MSRSHGYFQPSTLINFLDRYHDTQIKSKLEIVRVFKKKTFRRVSQKTLKLSLFPRSSFSFQQLTLKTKSLGNTNVVYNLKIDEINEQFVQSTKLKNVLLHLK